MYQLHVALPDLVVSDLDAAAPSLARLPVLERLLARADRHAADPDWRRWVLALAGLELPPGDLPVARTLAHRAGLAADEGGSWFVAAPVRLEAGLASVHFDALGPVPIAGTAAVVERFGAEFGDPSVALHAVGDALLLHSRATLDVRTRDAVALAGLGLDAGRPSGPDAGRLERLMTELQMWLHERPLEGRDGRRANALWLWGSGGTAVPAAGRWPALALADEFLHAAAAGAAPDASRLVDAYAVSDLVRDGTSFADADARWFAPLAARLADGEITALHLHCGGTVHAIAHRQRLRVWRRARPWWEQLA